MCGQFHIESKDIHYLKNKFKYNGPIPAGDIKPSNPAFVILDQSCDIYQFGLSRKSLLINARCETIQEKKTFLSIIDKPCVIPASYYYEWDPFKSKVTLYSDHLLYFAGLYSNHQFIIITTAANQSVTTIHDRMPLILKEDEIDSWLHHDLSLLNKTCDSLKNNRKYEQIQLF